MLFVSDFADGAVLLPVAAAVAVLLGVLGWWRGLAGWAIGVGGAALLVVVLKALGVALMDDLDLSRPLSPSGHVAGACAVYGGLAVLLLRGSVPLPLLAVPPLAVAGVFGWLRIGLAAHSPSEAVAGGVIGCAGVALMAAVAGPRPARLAWPAFAAACCTVLAFHGLHLHTEEAIQLAFSAR